MSNLPNVKIEKIYTILELNSTVQRIIQSEFPESIWVCGEIQGLRLEREKKHIYFELIQKHAKIEEIVAKVRVALFAGRKPLVYRRIQETNGAFELKNDIEVKFLCQVSLHPPTGQYSLIIVDIDPIYTLGKFAQNRRKIIDELNKKGLLDKNKTKDIPILPLNIGLITAHDSAAYHDFINELRLSGYGFKVGVYNCYMQGKNTENDVVKALNFFNNSKLKPEIVVITRGGGSTADLSWFDNKKIASSVAYSEIPVISALGHQTDNTITDLVCHTSLKTPTKVAQFLVECIDKAYEVLMDKGSRIIEQADSLLEDSSRSLESKALYIDSLVNKYFRHHRERLAQIKSLIISTAGNFINFELRKVEHNIQELKGGSKKFFEAIFGNIKYTEDKICLLNPLNVLRRGYSIAFKQGKAVKSAADLKKGDKIKTVFFAGEAVSRVEKIASKVL